VKILPWGWNGNPLDVGNSQLPEEACLNYEGKIPHRWFSLNLFNLFNLLGNNLESKIAYSIHRAAFLKTDPQIVLALSHFFVTFYPKLVE